MNNLKLIFTLLVGIVFGIGFNSLFSGNAADPVKQSDIGIVRPKILDKEVKAANQQIAWQVDSLKQHSRLLNQDLQNNKLQVARAKKQDLLLRVELQSLATSTNHYADPIEQNNDCDSLQHKILLLLDSDSLKDNLQEMLSVQQDNQIKNKDSTIELLTNQTQQLKLSFDESIHNQEILYSQNRLYEKQFKRQKIKRKLKATVTVIAAGLAGYYLLTH